MLGQKCVEAIRAIAGFECPDRTIDRPMVLLARLTIVQAGLLALGLWLHDHFLVAAARMEAQNAKAGSAAQDGGLRRFTLDADPDSPLEAAGLVGMMPATRWFTLAWVACLQASAAFLVYCRLSKETAQTQTYATETVAQQQLELIRTRDAIIFGLARLAESRDRETGRHLERIASYSTRLAAELRKLPRYQEAVSPGFVRVIGVSSALHDIGKVGVSDAILLKPGRLTPEERIKMETHAALGGDCIREIERQLGGASFLRMARDIAYAHHERWDGLGYPFGLAGEDIPLSARIVAIADVYDALSVRRVYKTALPHEQCVSLILDQSGKQFDPELVEVFLRIAADFRRIAEQFADPKPASPPEITGAPGGSARLSEADERLLLSVVEADERVQPALKAL